MKRSQSIITALFATTTLFSGLAIHAQAPCVPPAKHKHSKKVEPCATAEKQLADLQAQLKAQQAQIDALSQQLASKPGASAETDPIATPIANQAAADAADAKAKVNGMSSSVADLKSTVAGEQETILATQKKISDLESPTAIHYKNVLITPGGFLAAESAYRYRAMNSNIATPFSALPYPNTANYHLSEFNGSAQQSRLSMLVMAPFAFGKAGGYVETDFLSAGTTSNNNQTNSYTLRVRSAFGQVQLNNGFSFQGGQMFTLATEVKKGILAGPSAEALPPTIDPNYTVGFNFGRQYALRFAKSLAAGKANVALSLEESQIILAGTTNAPSNFFFGGAGQTGGLFNNGGFSGAQNYTDNLAPDIHVKATFDPGIGHYEIGGVLREFRDRVYAQSCSVAQAAGTACPAANIVTSTTGTNYTTPGGGLYASARVPATKYVDVALKGYFGPGMARYGASNLGDVTVRPSGQLEPLKTVGGLFEFDLHPTKKLDVFFLNGMEYLQRTTYISPLTLAQVGYAGIQGQNDAGCYTQAAPTSNNGYSFSTGGTCSGSTRYLLESSGGITYRFFTSPTKGRFQMQAIFSYFDRQSWQGYIGSSYAASVAGGPSFFRGAQGVNSMVTTSFRYYIP